MEVYESVSASVYKVSWLMWLFVGDLLIVRSPANRGIDFPDMPKNWYPLGSMPVRSNQSLPDNGTGLFRASTMQTRCCCITIGSMTFSSIGNIRTRRKSNKQLRITTLDQERRLLRLHRRTSAYDSPLCIGHMEPALTIGNVKSMTSAHKDSSFHQNAHRTPWLHTNRTFQPVEDGYCFEAVTYTNTLSCRKTQPHGQYCLVNAMCLIPRYLIRLAVLTFL